MSHYPKDFLTKVEATDIAALPLVLRGLEHGDTTAKIALDLNKAGQRNWTGRKYTSKGVRYILERHSLWARYREVQGTVPQPAASYEHNVDVDAGNRKLCHGWTDQHFRHHPCPMKKMTTQWRCPECNRRTKSAHLVYVGEYDGEGA